MNDAAGPRLTPGLARKLQLLLRLRRTDDGHIPSARDISTATAAPGQARPEVSHTQVNDLINARNGNPRLSTLTALARAFDVPEAFLLPGWDDLNALTVFHNRPQARQAVRLMQDLEEQDVARIVQVLQEIRRQRGLPEEVPEMPTAPAGSDQPRQGRPRRRLTFAEAAERAADDLEGI